ncbi:MAG: tRNA (adenosine(37)-N6)-dimethylallyltransferase MiaA [Fibromonadales bacterium]|nr:tRNA (adenosine(37)-N6)-dimethylallyltransferase MiaA [Fibromonadales bacterium]
MAKQILGAILGATGSGKTEFAVLLAQKLNAEIICMDSRQVYENFKIGTAQPSAEHLKAVKHHLVNFLPPEKQYNAAEFAASTKRLLEQNPNAKFLIVGGTGLYLQALCLGLSPLPQPDPELREKLKERYIDKPNELYKDALKASPGIEGKIMPRDTQRLLRTLELAGMGHGKSENEISGKSEIRGSGNRVGGIGPVPSVWLDFPREELYRRINERVVWMLKNGWPEEVLELAKSVPFEAPAWQSLGYADLRQVLGAGKDPMLMAEGIALKSRHYAKRQITWFKSKEKPIYIDGRSAMSEDCLKKVCRFLHCTQ